MHKNRHLPLVESVHRTDGRLGWRLVDSAVVQSDNDLPSEGANGRGGWLQTSVATKG
jgi:hypothetical protein